MADAEEEVKGLEFVDEEEEDDVKDAEEDDLTDDDEDEEEITIGVADVEGEEFMSVKPWLGAIKPPTDYVEDAAGAALPHQALELQRVYGYRSRGVYNNVHFDFDGNIVYPAAAVAVMADIDEKSQRFYQGHVDDIICLNVDPTRRLCATGGKATISDKGRGVGPSIHIWNIESGERICKIQGAHKRVVTCITFSPDSRYIASVGLDNRHKLCVHSVETGELVDAKETGDYKVLSISWSAKTGMICTTGVKHCAFWPASKGRLGRPKKGLVGSKGKRCTQICQTTSRSGNTWTGTASGEIYMYRGNRLAKVVKAHRGRTCALVTGSDFVASGGLDGKIKFWSFRGECTGEVSVGSCVRALSISSGTNLACGTSRGQVMSVKYAGGEADIEVIATGHYDGETWALAANPDGDMVMTGGDDNLLCLWSVEGHKLLTSRIIAEKADKKAAAYQKRRGARRSTMAATAPNQCCRAADWGPNGYIIIGLNDGRILSLNEDDLSTAGELRVSRKPITVVKSGPIGDLIAAGCADFKTYIISLSPDDGSLTLSATCGANTSPVTHLDWDESELAIQTNSSGYDLLFFTAESGAHEPSGASLFCDEPWSTWTCRLGWPVQGIWYDFSKGSDINTVDRHVDGELLAVGDDRGRIRLFKYPCLTKAAEHRTYRGHASHLTNLKFLGDGETLMSLGGNDNTMLQWRLL